MTVCGCFTVSGEYIPEKPVDMSCVLSMVVDGDCNNFRKTSGPVMYTVFGLQWLIEEITITSEKLVDL